MQPNINFNFYPLYSCPWMVSAVADQDEQQINLALQVIAEMSASSSEKISDVPLLEINYRITLIKSKGQLQQFLQRLASSKYCDVLLQNIERQEQKCQAHWKKCRQATLSESSKVVAEEIAFHNEAIKKQMVNFLKKLNKLSSTSLPI